jgi:hypothetical protein
LKSGRENFLKKEKVSYLYVIWKSLTLKERVNQTIVVSRSFPSSRRIADYKREMEMDYVNVQKESIDKGPNTMLLKGAKKSPSFIQ